MTKRALVIGSGIAGPVVASALAGGGFEATVYEAWPAGSAADAGSWLSVAVNGLEALRALDLQRAVADVSFATEAVELLNGSGKRLGIASLGGALEGGMVTRTIRRADLHRVLTDGALKRGVRYEYEKRLVSAETRSDGRVTATFADGTQAEGDVLIGADGVHSTTRSLIDPCAPSPRETNMGNVGGFVPASKVDVPQGTYRMIFGKRAFFGYVVHPSGDVWWFANPPVPYPPEPDGEWLASLFSDDVAPCAALVRATPAPLRFFRQYELAKVPMWRRGSIILVGDAAHAASPTSGQGASLAIEDGVALAQCLRAAPVPDALARFESMRRARVERVVREAARMSTHKVPGALGRFARDLMLPAVLSYAAKQPRDWLFSYRVPESGSASPGASR